MNDDPGDENVHVPAEYERTEVPLEFQTVHGSLEDILDAEVDRFVNKYDELVRIKDPDEDPFRSRYLACDVLAVLKKKILDLIPTVNSTETKHKATNFIGQIDFLVGIVQADVEELQSAETNLLSAIEVLQQREIDDKYMLIQAYNQLAVASVGRGNAQRSLELLQKAMLVYKEMARVCDQNEIDKLESMHTLSLFYMAQIYGQLGDTDNGAAYCEMCLSRELESGDYVGLEWVSNCTNIIEHYRIRSQFERGFTCLTEAKRVLETSLKKEDGTPKAKSDYNEEERKTVATVAVTEGRLYCAELADMEMRFRSGNPEAILPPTREPIEPSQQPPQTSTNPKYRCICTDKIYGIPARTHHSPIRKQHSLMTEDQWDHWSQVNNKKSLESPKKEATLPNARRLFRLGLAAFTTALEFFVLDGYVTDHVRIQQDLGEMYGMMVPFYNDVQTQTALLKKKVNLLEPLIRELNPDSYKSLLIDLTYSVASTFETLSDWKMDQCQQDKSDITLKILIEYTAAAIRHYRMFLAPWDQPNADFTGFNAANRTGSIRNEPLKINQLPPTNPHVDEEMVASYLTAHLCIARLFTRVPSTAVPLENYVERMKLSYQEYLFIIQYHDKMGIKDIFTKELELCRTMASLLPQKISEFHQVLLHSGQSS
ncbi:putative KIF-binding protein [Blattamonas nauphoetae]|uniref:KIF-binding protein n=1 Tax=Blattamonas nauphoetae TaxID=2049346 RepID=A0ABQ9Y492_9EUKA|nr:putative KIF-binding protein [Blattamonas nauphoetae]